MTTNPDPNTVFIWLANWNLSEADAEALLSKNYGPSVTMVDTIHANVHNIPQSTVKVAGYDTGTRDIAWTTEDWARFADDKTGKVQINQSPSAPPLDGNVIDSEPGAWSIDQAVAGCETRRKAGRYSTVYVNASDQAAMEAALRTQGFNDFPVVAVQWASPSSNPDTNLPGSSLTLSQANCDLSVACADWFAPSGGTTPPPDSQTGLVVTETLTSHTVKSVDGGKTWTVD